jgi:SAM-dependent methyltransferase
MTSTFKDHFSGHAAAYADYRPTYPPALAAALAEAAPGRALALDCGCGSGQLSLLLADHFERVVATDASAEQIANAFPHPRVSYAVAPAEQSGLADRSADLVVAAQAAHWFDLPAFWREVDRVACDGGAVALVGYGVVRIDDELDPMITEFHDETLREYWPPERWLVVEGYVGVEFPYRELATPQFEMTVSWSLHQFIRYFSTSSAVKLAERTTGTSPLPAFAARLATLWGDADAQRTVRWPLSIRLGRVGER